jgi:hypothetical protein
MHICHFKKGLPAVQDSSLGRFPRIDTKLGSKSCVTKDFLHSLAHLNLVSNQIIYDDNTCLQNTLSLYKKILPLIFPGLESLHINLDLFDDFDFEKAFNVDSPQKNPSFVNIKDFFILEKIVQYLKVEVLILGENPNGSFIKIRDTRTIGFFTNENFSSCILFIFNFKNNTLFFIPNPDWKIFQINYFEHHLCDSGGATVNIDFNNYNSMKEGISKLLPSSYMANQTKDGNIVDFLIRPPLLQEVDHTIVFVAHLGLEKWHRTAKNIPPKFQILTIFPPKEKNHKDYTILVFSSGQRIFLLNKKYYKNVFLTTEKDDKTNLCDGFKAMKCLKSSLHCSKKEEKVEAKNKNHRHFSACNCTVCINIGRKYVRNFASVPSQKLFKYTPDFCEFAKMFNCWEAKHKEIFEQCCRLSFASLDCESLTQDISKRANWSTGIHSDFAVNYPGGVFSNRIKPSSKPRFIQKLVLLGHTDYLNFAEQNLHQVPLHPKENPNEINSFTFQEAPAGSEYDNFSNSSCLNGGTFVTFYFKVPSAKLESETVFKYLSFLKKRWEMAKSKKRELLDIFLDKINPLKYVACAGGLATLLV